MKKIGLYCCVGLLLFVSSGCTAVRNNTYEIKQLKNQLVTVENALARQNLYIQQNRSEMEALLDRSEELAVHVARVKQSQQLASVSAGTGHGSVSVAVGSDDVSSNDSSVFSDKLPDKPTVFKLQKALRNAGFYMGAVDGKSGPMTRAAVTQFQKANGLVSDGVVGKQTWAKLKDYL